jgi:hypothetical protein
VSFVHRFGSALNANLHFHCCIIEGVFSPEAEDVRFHEATALTDEDLTAAERKVRTRVLRLFKRRDLLSPDDAALMRQWQHGGGFSLDAKVRIEATDRKGLERLLRYCARPIPFDKLRAGFASERLEWLAGGQRLVSCPERSRRESSAQAPAGRANGADSHAAGTARPAGGAHPTPAPSPPSVSRCSGASLTPARGGDRWGGIADGRGYPGAKHACPGIHGSGSGNLLPAFTLPLGHAARPHL